jgi:threonyl-tRNA synthetase
MCSITNNSNDYILKINKDLDKVGIRNEIDLRNEKIGYKIREHSNNAIPIIIVIGEKEQQTKTVAVRYLGSKNQENLDLETFIENVKRKCLPPDLV